MACGFQNMKGEKKNRERAQGKKKKKKTINLNSSTSWHSGKKPGLEMRRSGLEI